MAVGGKAKSKAKQEKTSSFYLNSVSKNEEKKAGRARNQERRHSRYCRSLAFVLRHRIASEVGTRNPVPDRDAL
jgi:hypothetical protein